LERLNKFAGASLLRKILYLKWGLTKTDLLPFSERVFFNRKRVKNLFDPVSFRPHLLFPLSMRRLCHNRLLGLYCGVAQFIGHFLVCLINQATIFRHSYEMESVIKGKRLREFSILFKIFFIP